MSHESLPHPSDAKFRATGDTLADAFAAAVEAVGDLAGAAGTGEPVRKDVSLHARTRESLLFDLLDQVVLFQDVAGAVVDGVTDLSVDRRDDGVSLTGTLHGHRIADDEARLDVKAPTYSEMRVDETDDGCIVEAVLDL
jgi:SHS2 domain-containing protein